MYMYITCTANETIHGNHRHVTPLAYPCQEEFTQREGVWKLQNDATKECNVNWAVSWAEHSHLKWLVYRPSTSCR